MSLNEVIEHASRFESHVGEKYKRPSWKEVLEEEDDDSEEQGCLLCHL